MNRREKILAIGLLAAVGLWAGRSLVSDVLMAPINNREAQIKDLEASVEQQGERLQAIMAATKKFADLKRQSLPPDYYDAAALYKMWLLERAEAASLQNVRVERNRDRISSVKNTYGEIGMTVSAKGTLKQVADYLFTIQSADLLQKVRKVQLRTDEHQGDPALDVSILIDAVAIDETDPRDVLFEEGRAEAVSEVMAGKTREQYAVVTERNPFVRSYNGPPVAEKPPEKTEDPEPQKPGIDAAEHVYLVGSIAKGERWDAVLYDRTTNRETFLRTGEKFDVAGIQGTVVTIGSDFLTMQINDVVWRLELGQNLRQIEKVEAEKTAAENPTTASAE